MNGTFSGLLIFLAPIKIVRNFLNLAPSSPIDADMWLITEQLPFSPERFHQVNNEALYPNPHPFWPEQQQQQQQSGMLRVKELAQPSPPNHKTHRTPCPTTGHLEEVSGTAKAGGGGEGGGGFLRSSEL